MKSATVNAVCHTEGGPSTRTRSRVGNPTREADEPRSVRNLKIFDIPAIEGSASHPRPHLVDSAETHVRDCHIAMLHAVPPDYRESMLFIHTERQKLRKSFE